MHRAYELVLQDRGGERRTHMFACETTEQVMQHARDLLDGQDLELVEVRVAGVHLFTVSR